MLRWAITFFIIAIIAAALGFSRVAGDASTIGYYLAVAFVILAVISLVVGRGAAPPA
jgi:uncharacterized membrane protein YtjA (UPF0391 family)